MRRSVVVAIAGMVCAAGCAAPGAAHAQLTAAEVNGVPTPMGSISTVEARVSGGVEVEGARARLLKNVSVTAMDRTAWVDLNRGGGVAVCSSSEFHLLRSGTSDSLMFSLDRGAVEIRSFTRPDDAVVTPDLRFTMLTTGPMDLRLRVTREGDTCVENRGDRAPVINVVESFGKGSYHVMPGQHVMFEHGNLREVVDHEGSACGCPEETPTMVAANTMNATAAVSAVQAAAQNPFPVAQSVGLTTQPAAVNVAAAAPTAALTYSGEQAVAAAVPGPAATVPATVMAATASASAAPVAAALVPVKQAASQPAQAEAGVAAPAEPPAAPPGAHDLAHAIGHFFRRLFGRK